MKNNKIMSNKSRRKTIEMLDLMKREMEEDIKYHPTHWLNKIHRPRIKYLENAIKLIKSMSNKSIEGIR